MRWLILYIILSGSLYAQDTIIFDDFSDGIIDSNNWIVGGGGRGYSTVDSSIAYWSVDEIIDGGGYIQARATVETTGYTYGSGAWIRSINDFSDGNNYLINFRWQADVQTIGEASADVHAIQITDGFIEWGTNVNIANERIGTFNLYHENNHPISSAGWSILIDGKNWQALLYEGYNCTGRLHSVKQIDKYRHGHLRFITSVATSEGFPAKDCRLNLFEISVIKTSVVAQGAVIDSIVLPDSVMISGLTYDGNNLWVSDYNGLELDRVDILTGDIIASYKQKVYDAEADYSQDIAYDTDLNMLYYKSVYGSFINRVDLSTGYTIDSVSSALERCYGMDINTSYIWMQERDTLLERYRVYKYSALTGALVGGFTVPNDVYGGAGIVFGDDYLWYCNDDVNRYYKIDVNMALTYGKCDNAIIDSFDCEKTGRLAWDGQYLWAGGLMSNKLYKIAPQEMVKTAIRDDDLISGDASFGYGKYSIHVGNGLLVIGFRPDMPYGSTDIGIHDLSGELVSRSTYNWISDREQKAVIRLPRGISTGIYFISINISGNIQSYPLLIQN